MLKGSSVDQYTIPVAGENPCDDIFDVFHYFGDDLGDICERLNYTLHHWQRALDRRDNARWMNLATWETSQLTPAPALADAVLQRIPRLQMLPL